MDHMIMQGSYDNAGGVAYNYDKYTHINNTMTLHV